MGIRAKIVAMLILICSAGLSSFWVAHRATSQAGGIISRPFLAQLVEKHFTEAERAVPAKYTYSLFARRSDGSEARIISIESPHGELGELVNFVDVSKGTQVSLSPFTESVTTRYYSSHDLGHLVSSNDSCLAAATDPAAERTKMLGYDVVLITKESVGPEGDILTIERWAAVELGCFPLRESATLASGPRNEKEVVLLIEGEPPDSIFAIPAGYVERSPSQNAAAYAEKFPGYLLVPEETAQQADESYYAHQR